MVDNYPTLVNAENDYAALEKAAKSSGGLGAGFIVLMTMLSIIVAACIVLLVLYTLDKKGKLKRKDK